MKSITIVIITYNSEKCIARCIESIKNSASRNLRFNLILIDNASADNSVVALMSATKSAPFIQSKLIQNKKNWGFASAVNQGIEFTQTSFDSDYFLLLNPDAYLEKNCLKILIKKAEENQKLGLISPLIIAPDTNQPWFSGARINWPQMKTQHLNSENFQSQTRNHYLSGCCLLIKKAVIEKSGLFDKRFFLYYEDADFSLRAQRAGFSIALESGAICWHRESQSSTSEIKNYHLVKSGLLFFHKHYPKVFLLYFWKIFYLRYLYHKLFSKKKEVLRAMKDFLAEKGTYRSRSLRPL